MPERPLDELVPGEQRRSTPARLPEVSELELVRHFTELSTLNYGVDNGPYPLGSCTMKYNPKVNERLAALEGFGGLHPYQPEALVQGALELMHDPGGLARRDRRTQPGDSAAGGRRPRRAHGLAAHPRLS